MRPPCLFLSILLAGASLSWPQDSLWALVWSDEFNAHFLDTASWSYDVGTGDNGWGNNELQYYTPGNNLLFNDTCLVIELRKEIMGGAQYTSARINTRKKVEFMYGKIQARIKAPYSQAVWPSFWTLGTDFEQVGWPACGETDIFEMACGEYYPDNRGDNTNFAVVHFNDAGGFPVEKKGYVSLPTKMADDFHVFTLVWDPDSVWFFFDSALAPYFKAEISDAGMDAFRQPHSLVIDMALGGTGFAGLPDGSTVLPQRLYVDWVRWYQKKTGVLGEAGRGKADAPQILRLTSRGIVVNLTRPQDAFVKIYRCDGKLAADLTSAVRCMSPGTHFVPTAGLRLRSGTYLVRSGDGGRAATARVSLIP